MLWGYMERVESYFQQELYIKYGHVFGSIWIASAYKGASGELAVVTSIEHHYRNHVSWLEVMLQKVQSKILTFKGIAITGWSRYDHFLALCDLLPVAIPSLVVNLKVMQIGPLSDNDKSEVIKKLGCVGKIPWTGEDVYGSVKCTFPGNEVYSAVLPITNIFSQLDGVMEFAEKYMTPINLEYSYIHKMRAVEVSGRVKNQYASMMKFMDDFTKACDTMYWEDTAKEWLMVYFLPRFDPLYKMVKRMNEIREETHWKPRPMPITLKDYAKI